MPILDDIMDHGIIGRERKRGIIQALIEAREAREKETRRLVLGWIRRRFGPVPTATRKHFEAIPSLA